MNTFKLNIKYLRSTKNLFQLDFSKVIDVKRTSVASWEQGIAYPNMDTLIRIKDYFEVSLDELLTTKMETVQHGGPVKEYEETTAGSNYIEETGTPYNKEQNIGMLIESNNKLANAAEINARNMENLVNLLASKVIT